MTSDKLGKNLGQFTNPQNNCRTAVTLSGTGMLVTLMTLSISALRLRQDVIYDWQRISLALECTVELVQIKADSEVARRLIGDD